VLVVTTTVGMLYGVHRHTTHTRPAVSLLLVLVEGVTGLEHGLIETGTTGDDTDHDTAGAGDLLAGSRGETDHGLGTIVTHDGAASSGGTSDSTTVSVLVFDHADDGTFGALSDGQAVADGELGGGTAVDVLALRQTFDSDHNFLVDAILVLVAEVNRGKRGTTTRVVDDVADDALDVAVTFGEIDGTQAGGTLATLGLRAEDDGFVRTLSLTTDDSTHFFCCAIPLYNEMRD